MLGGVIAIICCSMLKKTKVLNISVYKSINLLNGLCIGNMWLETVDAAKLLGVLIDSHLTFGPHMAKIVSKARQKLYSILRLRQYGVNTARLVRFYTACVRPALTNAAPVWYTHLTIQSKTMLGADYLIPRGGGTMGFL